MCRALHLAILFGLASCAFAEPPRLEFTRLICHWDTYSQREPYLSFIKDASPEIVQVGEYGGHFFSLVHTPHGAGYPAHFPLQGIDECGAWFTELNREIHARNAKVIGHFNIEFLVGDPESPEGPRGFFKFYRDLWNEKELGKKPVENPLDLLEKNADGTPISNSNYSIGGMKEYWACLNNPHWQTVLKAWTKRGIERGVDGYMINYFYRHNCTCEHCQNKFKTYLAERFQPDELAGKFGLNDLASHKFAEIVSWHDPKESTPLRREMLRFSQISNKQVFDEVFIKYGRSLKKNLIAAQWNHLGDFNQISGDERSILPKELWGKDEDYLWYSTGDAANSTDLAAGFLGEGTLQARYIRGAFDDKPFTLGKYESTRIRTAIAELAANGGAPMGFYTRFTDPAAREEIVRYYQFIKKHDRVFHANRSHAEVLLLFPRSHVHQGNVEIVETFKKIGRGLLDAHVLFDVLPDDLLKEAHREKYESVVVPQVLLDLSLLTSKLSRFKAPPTVRVSASKPAQGEALHLHFVNYNREEPAEKRSPGGGIQDEKPLATPNIKCDVMLPKDWKTVAARWFTPEQNEPVTIAVETKAGRATFEIPPFLVYGFCELEPK